MELKGNYCPCCVSNDYEEIAPGIVSERPVSRVHTPFTLERLSFEFLHQIIIKMNQRAFARIRRSSNTMHDFIENERKRMKIALFHNWKMKFDISGTLRLISPKKYIHDKNFDKNQQIPDDLLNFIPDLTIREWEDPEGNYQIFTFFERNCQLTQKLLNRNNRTVVSFNTANISQSSFFEKELFGVFKTETIELQPCTISHVPPFLVSPTVFTAIGQFIQNIRLCGKYWKISGFKPDDLTLEQVDALFGLAKPTGLIVYGWHPTLTTMFISSNGFEDVKYLNILHKDMNLEMELAQKKLEIVYNNCLDNWNYYKLLVSMWVSEKGVLREATSVVPDLSKPDIDDLVIQFSADEISRQEVFSMMNPKSPNSFLLNPHCRSYGKRFWSMLFSTASRWWRLRSHHGTSALFGLKLNEMCYFVALNK